MRIYFNQIGRSTPATRPGRLVFSLVILLSAVAHDPVRASAQQSPASPAAPSTQNSTAAPPRSEQELLDEQLAVTGRYQRFERMLSQMADLLAKDDPEKADLLRRAIGKGREQAIGDRLENVIQLMESKEFGTAIEKQSEVSESLLVMLQLLQSEDRRSSVEKERERLNQVLTDVRNLINGQRSTRAATQNSPSPSNAAPAQQQNLKDADQLLQDIRQHDREAASGNQTNPGESRPQETQESQQNGGRPQEGRESQGKEGRPQETQESQQNGGRPQEGRESQGKEGRPQETQESQQNGGRSQEGQESQGKEGRPQETQDPQENSGRPQEGRESQGKSGQPQEGQESQGKSGQPQGGQNSQGKQQQQQQQTPGSQKIDKARQMMQEALDALKEQNRRKAVENQDESLNNLHEAAAELEEMLRQLREEEKEMLLAALEARFQRMLALQTQIHEGTLELSGTPLEKWPEQYKLRAKDLSQQQTELTSECSQTTGLLREDGSSVSILIAVEDIERDMSSISGLLRENKVTGLTQTMQLDVIEALKELIEATQKEMQEMKSEQRQQQAPPEGPQEKPPLVELKAEILMLKSLQLRVNRRTQQLDQLIRTAESAEKLTIQTQVQELARRQHRLIQSAKELAQKVDSK